MSEQSIGGSRDNSAVYSDIIISEACQPSIGHAVASTLEKDKAQGAQAPSTGHSARSQTHGSDSHPASCIELPASKCVNNEVDLSGDTGSALIAPEGDKKLKMWFLLPKTEPMYGWIYHVKAN